MTNSCNLPTTLIGMTLCLLMSASFSTAQMNFTLPPLPYPYSGLENWIDTETMNLHHTKHHQAAVNNLNAAISQSPDLAQYMLTALLQNVGTLKLPRNITLAIRNNAGSHFNHAMFWLTMRPVWYDYDPAKPRNIPSEDLNAAINKSFGSVDAFKAMFSEAAAKLFGSGWTWLCLKGSDLVIATTPNQDNPLMTYFVHPADRCTPILGIDVWEHAYYLKHRNVRQDYITSWWNVVNWVRVSQNYEAAQKSDMEALWQ